MSKVKSRKYKCGLSKCLYAYIFILLLSTTGQRQISGAMATKTLQEQAESPKRRKTGNFAVLLLEQLCDYTVWCFIETANSTSECLTNLGTHSSPHIPVFNPIRKFLI